MYASKRIRFYAQVNLILKILLLWIMLKNMNTIETVKYHQV